MRFFQQHEYISVDFTRQDALRVRVVEPGPQPKFDFATLPAENEEPLRGGIAGVPGIASERAARPWWTARPAAAPWNWPTR